jgi:integrase
MNIPSSLKRKAEEISEDLLPNKSKVRYNDVYEKFLAWLREENVMPRDVSDDILLVYLSNLSKTNKSSTLWSKYSMIKSCLKLKQDIDASNFPKSIAFLKRQSVGYQPKKSSVLTANEVSEFMTKAPDNEWLLTKVALTLGVYGACRRDDLVNLNVNNVKDNGTYITIFLKDGKTHSNRTFTVTDEDCPFKPCQIIRKYMSLRPPNIKVDRFFVGYRLGKCFAQVVGKNMFASMPMKVAKFLGLQNPESYTGHAMRRSSASMLVEGGADLLTLKRHGGWKSSKVAEGYIEESLARKVEVSKRLFKTVHSPTSANKLQRDLPSTQPESLNRPTEKNNDNYFTIDNIFDDNIENELALNGQTQENVSVHLTTERRIQESNGKCVFSNNHNCTFNIYLNSNQK